MATMTNCYKLKVGFKVNPSEEVVFYFTSILSKSDIVYKITSGLELGRVCDIGGNIAINMGDVSWFRIEWESCS